MIGKRGFTLVEIMIVVAIIVILAAISMPQILRVRLNANEAAAIAATRTISTACESYRAAQTPPAYPASLATLGPTVSTPPYIDKELAEASTIAEAKQGYFYEYTKDTANEYTCLGKPAAEGTTGNRYFQVDESGVIQASSDKGTTWAIIE